MIKVIITAFKHIKTKEVYHYRNKGEGYYSANCLDGSKREDILTTRNLNSCMDDPNLEITKVKVVYPAPFQKGE